MKQVIKSIMAVFGEKAKPVQTVDTVLQTFNKTIEDLNGVAAEMDKQISVYEDTIEAAKLEIQHAESAIVGSLNEKTRATIIAIKIKDLVSV